MENRLNEIESKLAYQEDLLQSLNNVVAKQNAELASLQDKFNKLTRLLKNNMPEDSIPREANDEVPPHY